MNLEQQVTSVEVSNKLRKLFDEIGVRKESLFYRDWTGAKEGEIDGWGKPDWCEDNIPCYLVAELGEMLPKKLEINKNTWLLQLAPAFSDSRWLLWYEEEDGKDKLTIKGAGSGWLVGGKTEADARGEMLALLLENKLYPTPLTLP